ncbi:MAG: hypothetical protein HY718_11790 [Planctomycetes bacterium]|nr:hypothetical protein [Planctomycetota bacterium]
MKTVTGWRAHVAVLAVTVGATAAFGVPVLHSIGVLDPADPASAIYAISPDGTWAVGYSNGPNSTASANIQRAIVWSTGTGLVQLPQATDFAGAPVDTNGAATGVVVRPVAGTIGIGGGFMNTSNQMQMYYYGAPLATPGSGTWLSAPVTRTVGPYNTAAVRTTTIGTTEQWFVGGDRPGTIRDYVQGVDGGPSLDHRNSPYDVGSNSISGTANTAGWDVGNPSSARRAIWMNSNNGTVQTVIPGGSGVLSEAFGINGLNNILSGYDATDASNSQAFIWKVGDAAMTLLANPTYDAQATAIDVNLIGGDWIAAGYAAGGGAEQAVVWDTAHVWGDAGQPKYLAAMLAARGVDMSDWAALNRVTTMSDDGTTLAGYGKWAADGSTRGFVVVVPEPSMMLLLVLGGVPLLRRRR